MGTNANTIQQIVAASHTLETTFEQRPNGDSVSNEEAPAALSAYMKSNGKLSDQTFAALAQMNQEIAGKLEKARSLTSLPEEDRRTLRTDFYLVSGSVAKLTKNKVINDESFTGTAAKYRSSL